MQFNPDNVVEYVTPRPGRFAFRVIEARDEYTSGGKNPGTEMTSVKLEVRIDDGVLNVFDRFLNLPTSLFKVKQFCRSIGDEEMFNSGEFTGENIIDAEGLADFDFGEEKENSRGEPVRYLEVKRYVLDGDPLPRQQSKRSETNGEQKQTTTSATNGGDIPF